jgi:RNA polymerase sigma-70 factor, ECF subfamily
VELSSRCVEPTSTCDEKVLVPAQAGQASRAQEDAAQMLNGCRQYLLMIANDVIGPQSRAKLGASDLVQETFLEAQRHVEVFRGKTRAEMRAWLAAILSCRLANARQSYLMTQKRAGCREVALDPFLADSADRDGVFASALPASRRVATPRAAFLGRDRPAP